MFAIFSFILLIDLLDFLQWNLHFMGKWKKISKRKNFIQCIWNFLCRLKKVGEKEDKIEREWMLQRKKEQLILCIAVSLHFDNYIWVGDFWTLALCDFNKKSHTQFSQCIQFQWAMSTVLKVNRHQDQKKTLHQTCSNKFVEHQEKSVLW